MYKVKIFFGSFYGEWFENDFLEDMDWSDISVAECRECKLNCVKLQ